MKVLLAHTPEMRRNYYGERSLKSLQALAEVILHQGEEPLDAAGLVRAASDADIIVADRMTEGRGEIFPQLPKLRAFVRCAVDIRNVNVEAASQAGVLVTRAGPGFIQAVAELALGFMVDLSRGVSRTTADYQAARKPDVRMGRQLAGSKIGIIGYGSIGRYLSELAKALRMEVLVSDPFVSVSDPAIKQVALGELLAVSDYVVCLAIANEQTENLIGAAALARMQRHAVFINLSSVISSTKLHLLRRCARTASPAPRWMSVARLTKCRRRTWRGFLMSSPRPISAGSRRRLSNISRSKPSARWTQSSRARCRRARSTRTAGRADFHRVANSIRFVSSHRQIKAALAALHYVHSRSERAPATDPSDSHPHPGLATPAARPQLRPVIHRGRPTSSFKRG